MSGAAAAAALPSLGTAGKTAAAAGVFGLGWTKFAWTYSRSLFAFDAGFRFERMCAGYEFANAQQEMFRNDLVLMTELTARKMGVYTVLGTMGMAIYIAIFCAGRLALHGPSPPVFIMGLFLTNIAASFAYAGMGIWLGFHAMWRAKAACLHLSTRKIRLLIPSRKKLDEARKYNNQWEHQKLRDLLRVPYISDAVGWKWSGEVPDQSDDEDNWCDTTDGKVEGRASSAPPAGRRNKKMKRVPCWIQEEFEQDRVGVAGGSGNAGLPDNTAPEHFQLYFRAQKEWFLHDCYARICMFYSFLCFFQGGSFYSLGQICVELRAWWPMFAANMIFTVLHFLFLRFDIVKPDPKTLDPSDRNERLPYCQYFGTLTIPLAGIAMALDFRVEYWDVTVQLTWFLIFVCHICQVIYSLRLVELIIPKEIKRDDKIGGMWWPVGWKVPPSFQHVYYWVSPPTQLRPGQFDTVREMKQGCYTKSEGSAAEGQFNPDDELTRGLDNYFRWMLTVAWPKLSKGGQEKVRTLHNRFTDLVQRKPTTEVRNELGHVERELRALQQQESADAKEGGYSSGSGSDASSGSWSSGSGYSSGENGSAGYTKNTPRYHPNAHEFTKFNYADPSKLVLIITSTFAFAWMFLLLAMVIDRATGVQGLVTAPHWARPPMTRSSKYPWERGTPLGYYMYMIDHKPTPEELYWHENMKPRTKGWNPHWMTASGHERRLSDSVSSVEAGLRQEGMKQAFTSLVSSLPTPAVAEELLQRVPTKAEATALTNLEARFRPAVWSTWSPSTFTWPGFFDPKMLACPLQDSARHAFAITSRGVGAAANLDVGGDAERFTLTGIGNYPALLAASWSPGPKEGLMLVSKMGHLLHCPGARQGSRWNCGPLASAPKQVPLAEGSHLAAAATAWLPRSDTEPRLHAAVILANTPDVVALWALDGNTEAASWMPLGELPVPHRMGKGASLTFVNDGDLMLATADGATIVRRISDGSVVMSTPALNFAAEQESTVHWQAACGLHGPKGGIVHLSMRQHEKSRRPEVMVLDAMTPAA